MPDDPHGVSLTENEKKKMLDLALTKVDFESAASADFPMNFKRRFIMV